MNKLFLKRVGAYLLDCTILFFALILVNLFVPTFGNIRELNERLTDMTDKYMAHEITAKELTEESQDINYDISKATYLSSIAGVVIYILYFVVLPVYNNGQTLMKKVFKIKVLKTDDSKVDINTMFIRCLLPYGILMNLVLVLLLLFVSKSLYLNINSALSTIHMFLMIITIIMMATQKRGLHDYVANTKVEEI